MKAGAFNGELHEKHHHFEQHTTFVFALFFVTKCGYRREREYACGEADTAFRMVVEVTPFLNREHQSAAIGRLIGVALTSALNFV